MNICWIAATGYMLDPVYDVEQLKSIGPIWGSWTTWRSCATDNVICHDRMRAQELINRNFHQRSNFYTHRDFYQPLGRPTGIRWYDGKFDMAVDAVDDIVALHLAAQTADVILLLNFQFGEIVEPDDAFEKHKLINRHGLIHSIITQQAQTQWVAVDHVGKLHKQYQTLLNLTCDSLPNVLQLLTQ